MVFMPPEHDRARRSTREELLQKWRNIMASNVVGEWQLDIDWDHKPRTQQYPIFHRDGTWEDKDGFRGCWIQRAKLFFFNFTPDPGGNLIFTANEVNENTLKGIMGYAVPGGESGVWSGTRLRARSALAKAEKAEGAPEHDMQWGPRKKSQVT
jgi:hypothetical protein